MPRNPSTGIYTLPPIYLAIPGTTIIAAQHNTPFQDLQTDANAPRPVVAGGTGANNVTLAQDNLNVWDRSVALAFATPTATVDNTVPRFDGVSRVIQTSRLAVGDDGSLSTFSTDPGATGGPDIDAFRDSASPAASDILARLLFNGRDSAGNKQLYALIQAIITDPTTATEDAVLDFQTVVNAVVASRMQIGAGVFAPSLTDPGAGKANFAGFSVNNNPLWAAPDCVLEDQKVAGSSGGSATTAAWTTRVLNTKVRDPYNLVSLSSNQFTSTVDGWVDWLTTFCRCNSARSRLYNVTDGTVVSLSTTDFMTDNATSSSNVQSTGCAAVVGGKTYRIEYWIQVNGGAGVGLGYSNSSTPGTEIYSRLKFWRA